MNNWDKIIFYLDKNSIQYVFNPRNDHPDDKIFGEIIKSLKDHVYIPYSTAHLRDLFKNCNRDKKARIFTFKDLKKIQQITNGYYCSHDDKNAYFTPNTDVINKFKGFVRDNRGAWDRISQAQNPFDILSSQIQDNEIKKMIEQLKNYPFPDFFNQELTGIASFKELTENNPVSFADYISTAMTFSDKVMSEKQVYIDLRSEVNKLHDLEKENNKQEMNQIKSLQELDAYITSIKALQIFNISSFREFVDYALNIFYPQKNASLAAEITTAYLLLDMIGFDKEKIIKKNLFYNLNTDGLHLYFGALTHFIVSEDKGLRIKGKILFELLGIRKNIFSISDFMQRLQFTEIAENNYSIDFSKLFQQGNEHE